MRLPLALLVALATLFPARAEKPYSPPEELRTLATHVVVGRVEDITARREREGGFEFLRFHALVRIEAVEKGEGLEPGNLVGVRSWTKRWILPTTPPTDTGGHDPLPRSGQRVRVHFVADGYNGFGKTTDGGYDVVGRNGWVILDRAAPAASPGDSYDHLEADWRVRAAVVLGALGLVLVTSFFWLRRRK